MSKSHSVKPYLVVFGALMVLTVATVLVSYVHLPGVLALLVGLFIATVKASLVAAYFMHLKGERALIYGILGVTAFFVVGLFAVPILDSYGTIEVSVHEPAPKAEIHLHETGKDEARVKKSEQRHVP